MAFLIRPEIKSRAKDKWGSETEGHKTNGEVDIYKIQILVQAYNGHLD